jgi:hypothetical protein
VPVPVPVPTRRPPASSSLLQARSLIDTGLVDELRLITYPLISDDGNTLFARTERHRGLELPTVEGFHGRCLRLIYGIG